MGESLTQQEFSDFLAQSQLEIDGIEYRYEMFAQDTATRSQEFLKFLETGKLKIGMSYYRFPHRYLRLKD